MKLEDIRCACGRPLHYLDPLMSYTIMQLAAEHGEFVKIMRLADGRAWMVQRHYLALHGINEQDLGTDRIPHFEEIAS